MDSVLKERIDLLKSEINALRPLDRDTEGRIQQKFRLDWNYHSNNIEGNSLTFGETKSFLLHGITAAGKPLKDHLDIKGHNEAILMLDDIVKSERELNESFIRELHQLILHEPYNKPAVTEDGKPTTRRVSVGKYKSQPNHVITQTGETFYFANPEETPALMHDLMRWYSQSLESDMHAVELAALLHYRFIRIHPFDDGNGRVSRILMNLVLMKSGFPPVIIRTQKKDDYYRALRQADGGDTGFFVDYIARLQIDSLELYMKGAKGERIEEDDDIDKEIALFKVKFNASELTSSFRTVESQTRFINRVLIALLSGLYEKLAKLNDLFKSFDLRYELMNTRLYIDTPVMQPIGNIKKMDTFLDDLKARALLDTDFSYLQLFFQWNDLRSSVADNTYIDYNIKITFNRADVSITYKGSISDISIGYFDVLPPDRVNNIISSSAHFVMEQVENL